MKIKTTLNAVLTTMAGGVPVCDEASDKYLEKLLDQTRVLNMQLPYFENKNLTKEELRDRNREIKTEALLQKFPELEDMIEDLVFEGRKLSVILEKKGQINAEYLRRSDKLIKMAQERGLTKTMTINFESQNEQ